MNSVLQLSHESGGHMLEARKRATPFTRIAISNRRWIAVLALGVCLAFAGTEVTAAQRSIPDATITSVGSSTIVSIRFVSQGSDVAALQFDLEFDGSALTMASAERGPLSAPALPVHQFRSDTRYVRLVIDQHECRSSPC